MHAPTTPPRGMRGADGVNAGAAGYVPKPIATDNVKFLAGDGTWRALINQIAATVAESLAGTDTAKYNTPAGGNARALLGDSTRRTRDCFSSIGASSSRGYAALGAPGSLGTLPFTILKRVKMPPANPTGSRGLWTIGSSNSTSNVANGISMELRNDGAIWLSITGASGLDYNRATIANAVANYRGKWTALAFVRNATGNPSLYAEGAALAPVFENAGLAPTWQGTIASTYFVDGTISSTESWDGLHEPAIVILGALSAAEILEWTQTGRLPSWCEAGVGNATPRYTSDFSATTDSWSANLVAMTANIDGIGARNDNLRVALSGGNSNLHQVSRVLTTTVGNAYLYSVDVYIPSNNANPFGVNLLANGGSTSLATTVTKDAWVTLSGVFVENSDLQIRLRAIGAINSDGDVFYIRNVKIIDLGPIAKWVIQPCRIADDATGNRIPLVLTSGLTPITTRRTWRIPVAVDMTSTGNKQLLGAALFESPQNQALDNIDVECAGAPTFSIGDGTTATKYAASATYTAGRTRPALASPYPADSAKTGIYANVTGAHAASAAEKITISGHRTD